MKRGKNLIALVVAVILGLSLILIPVVSRLSPVQAAINWTKESVTLENELYVVDAWVIKESSTSYKMWYTHAQKDLTISEIIDVIDGLNLTNLVTDAENLDVDGFLDNLSDLSVGTIEGVLDGTATVIGYATSTNGRTWTRVEPQALGDSNTGFWNSVGAPSVIKNSDTDYEMWYTRLDTDLNQTSLQNYLTDLGGDATRKTAIMNLLGSTRTVIGYATRDGVSANWTPVNNEVLSAGGDKLWNSVGDPSVIKNSDTDYEMWYTRTQTDQTQTELEIILANISAFGIDEIIDILDGTSTVIGYATSANGTSWTVQDSQVLPETSGGAWDSVANPSVIKTGSSYEMWYTNVKTGLVEANLGTLLDNIVALGPVTLWNTLKNDGLTDFIAALVALDIDAIKSVLSGTSTVIGYANSSDGMSWTVQNSQHLTGSSTSPWSSVAAPSVVKTSDRYEMWYTDGISGLTWPNLRDLLLGDNLPIGYAYYTPSGPSRPRPPTVETTLFGVEGEFSIDDDGVIQETIEATSDAGDFTIAIPEDTIALDEDGDPLSTLTVELDLDPPDPPAEAHIIGIPYKLGPPGATFSPSITIEFIVDPLPPGVAVEDLVIAYYDEEAGEWVELPTTYDPATNTFTAEVEHFTTFAIIAVPPVVAPPAPAAFTSSSLSISPLEVDTGQTVTISISVANTGGESGSYTVVLKIKGVKEAEKRVTIAAGSSQTVSFSVTKEEAGSYTITVDGLSGSFTVVPVVVPPAPAAFTSSSLSISPLEIDTGQTVTISISVANTGGESGSYTVVLKIDGVKEAEETVTIAAGESQDVSFSVTREEAGTYSVDVSGLTGSFTVKEKVVPPVVPKPITWWVWLLVGLGVVVIGGLLAYFLWWKRRIA